MKNITLTLSLIALGLLSGCNDDDNTTPNTGFRDANGLPGELGADFNGAPIDATQFQQLLSQPGIYQISTRLDTRIPGQDTGQVLRQSYLVETFAPTATGQYQVRTCFAPDFRGVAADDPAEAARRALNAFQPLTPLVDIDQGLAGLESVCPGSTPSFTTNGQRAGSASLQCANGRLLDVEVVPTTRASLYDSELVLESNINGVLNDPTPVCGSAIQVESFVASSTGIARTLDRFYVFNENAPIQPLSYLIRTQNIVDGGTFALNRPTPADGSQVTIEVENANQLGPVQSQLANANGEAVIRAISEQGLDGSATFDLANGEQVTARFTIGNR